MSSKRNIFDAFDANDDSDEHDTLSELYDSGSNEEYVPPSKKKVGSRLIGVKKSVAKKVVQNYNFWAYCHLHLLESIEHRSIKPMNLDRASCCLQYVQKMKRIGLQITEL